MTTDGLTGEGDDSRERSANGGDDGRPSKCRRFDSDEAALRIPLTLGWKRETLIRAIGKSCVRDEVRTWSATWNATASGPSPITISRFSTRCIVGEFIQPLGDPRTQSGRGAARR